MKSKWGVILPLGGGVAFLWHNCHCFLTWGHFSTRVKILSHTGRLISSFSGNRALRYLDNWLIPVLSPTDICLTRDKVLDL